MPTLKQYEVENPDGSVSTYEVEYPDTPDAPHSAGGFMSSLADSAGKTLKGIGQLATLPITVSAEMAKKYLPSETPSGPRPWTPPVEAPVGPPKPFLSRPLEAVGEAVGQEAKRMGERWGSVDQIGETLYHDPVGAALDVSMYLMPAGWAAKGAGLGARAIGATRTGNALTKLGSGLLKASDVTNPAAALPPIWKAATGAVGKGRDYTAGRLLTHSLDQPYKLPERVRLANIATQIKEGIPLTKSGREKAVGVALGINDEFYDAALQADAMGGVVDPANVVPKAVEDIPEWGNYSVRGLAAGDLTESKDLTKQVDAIARRYQETHPSPYPVSKAADEARITARNLEYDTVGDTIETTARKAIRHETVSNVADELERLGFEGMKDKRAREASIWKFVDQMDRVLAKEAKSAFANFVPDAFAMGAAGGGAYAAGIPQEAIGPIALVAGVLRHAAGNPGFASKLALMLSTQSPKKFPALRSFLDSAASKYSKAVVKSAPVGTRLMAGDESNPE